MANLSTAYQAFSTSTNYSVVKVGLKYAYVGGKTVRVYIGLYVDSSYSGGYGSDYSTAKINGTTVRGNGSYSSGSYRVYGVGWTDMGYTDIAISSGGTGGSSATNVSWSFWSFHFQGTPSGTVTIPAGAVPASQYDAASSISGTSAFTAGSAGTLTITRNIAADYRHYVYAYYNGTNRETPLSNVTHGSFSWTPSLATWGAIMPNTLGPITITLYCNTYRSGTYIGQTSYNATIKMPNNIGPTISHTDVTMQNTFKDTYNLAGISKVYVKCATSTKYSASLSSCITTFNNTQIGTSTEFTSGALTGSGAVNLVSTAKDSRGLTASVTRSVVMTPYSRPSLSQVVSVRCNAQGEVDNEGIYLLPTFYPTFTDLLNGSVHDNEYEVSVRWKQKGTDVWSDYVPVTSGEPVDTTLGGTIPGGLNTDKTYDIQYSIQDEVGTQFDLEPYTYKDLVSTSFTLIDFAKYGKSLAFGKMSEAESLGEGSAFEVGMPSYFYDGLYGKYKEDTDFVNILDKLSIKQLWNGNAQSVGTYMDLNDTILNYNILIFKITVSSNQFHYRTIPMVNINKNGLHYIGDTTYAGTAWYCTGCYVQFTNERQVLYAYEYNINWNKPTIVAIYGI